jgi:hypothetical protein
MRALAAFLLVGALPGVAWAQGQPSAADTALARNLAVEGIQLADKGDCVGAIPKLEKAEAIYHAPTILGRLGECQVAVGKIVAGTENLQRVVRQPLPDKPPAAFVQAQARARKVLEGPMPKVAHLKIHVEMPAGAQPTITLDGEPVSLATLDLDRPADPGQHVVEARLQGYRNARADLALQPGGAGTASLRLDPEAPGAAPAPAAAAAPAPYAAPAAQPYAPAAQPYPAAQPVAPAPAAQPVGVDTGTGGGGKTAGYVLLGVGGVGLVVGSAFGVMAMGKKSSLDGACTGGKASCPATSQSDIDSMKSSATISTVGVGVGAAALVVGVILLATSGGGKEAPRAAKVEPWIGAGFAGARGVF